MLYTIRFNITAPLFHDYVLHRITSRKEVMHLPNLFPIPTFSLLLSVNPTWNTPEDKIFSKTSLLVPSDPSQLHPSSPKEPLKYLIILQRR